MNASTLRGFSFKNVVIVSIVVRIVLIFYSEWHDKHSIVKYTDVDYRVFTDAARFLLRPIPASGDNPENIAQGSLGKLLGFGDPYYRETYRYTPLLALIMTPNIFLHSTFGKYLFAACDILVGILLYRLLRSTVLPGLTPSAPGAAHERQATLYAALHLLNPMVFSISTRGSSESTLGALVIGTLYFAMNPAKTQRTVGCDSCHARTCDTLEGVSAHIWREPRYGYRIGEGKGSWGYPFLYETYLYHIHRLDHQHNFSPYWLPIALTLPAYAHLAPARPALWQHFARSPLASFVPQMGLSLGTGLAFGRAGVHHLPFTWFVQTAAFVTLNKVCTSQYFLWYLTILPLVLPSLSFTRTKAVSLIGAWVGAQALWLKFAYDLEFLGKDVHYRVWTCSLLFLVVNCWVLWEIVLAYRWESPASNANAKKTT
ncbi:glycosyltransferase family 50 protein [Phellopilus nigrolimitatus]|nr:glycosyltransferase family 50 protein [Phellopilus nigrolimitatus]